MFLYRSLSLLLPPFVCLGLLATRTQAFLQSSPLQRQHYSSICVSSGRCCRFDDPSSSSVILWERRWNFNDGQGPWGLKKNAEIWNGRVAQMAFVVIFVQELIQGKGVIQGIQDGDPANLVAAGMTVATVVGLTGWLAVKGANDYTLADIDGL